MKPILLLKKLVETKLHYYSFVIYKETKLLRGKGTLRIKVSVDDKTRHYKAGNKVTCSTVASIVYIHVYTQKLRRYSDVNRHVMTLGDVLYITCCDSVILVT